MFALRRTRGLGRGRLRRWWLRCLRGAGIPVAIAAEITPTPALSFAVRRAEGGGWRDDYVEP